MMNEKHVMEADDLTDPDDQEAVVRGMLAEREARERIRCRTDPATKQCLGCLVDSAEHTCGYRESQGSLT